MNAVLVSGLFFFKQLHAKALPSLGSHTEGTCLMWCSVHTMSFGVKTKIDKMCESKIQKQDEEKGKIWLMS